MKSHLLRLQDLVLFVGLDDLLLVELGLEVPPFFPFAPFEFSPFSANKNRNKTDHYNLLCK